MPNPETVPASRLLRRLHRPDKPVDSQSVALYRLGEQCNNACPMCSNSGRPEAFFQETDELLTRADFLARQGFRRVVVTGGEPTIHPGFWDIIGRLGEHDIAWDINTHGRTFSDPAFAARAQEKGLRRAIVSLHSHLVEPSCVVSGIKEPAHHETVEGIGQLLDQGIEVMINLVVTTHNQDHLGDFVDWCAGRYGTRPRLKIAFPSTTGKGGGWEGIHVRYDGVEASVRQARERAADHGLELVFESFPNCVLGDPQARNMGRSGFGETHYLDDISGDAVYPIQYIESVLSVYPESCGTCRAVSTCPGIAEGYVQRHGVDEFVPFP